MAFPPGGLPPCVEPAAEFGGELPGAAIFNEGFFDEADASFGGIGYDVLNVFVSGGCEEGGEVAVGVDNVAHHVDEPPVPDDLPVLNALQPDVEAALLLP